MAPCGAFMNQRREGGREETPHDLRSPRPRDPGPSPLSGSPSGPVIQAGARRPGARGPDAGLPHRLLSPRPSLLTPTSDARTNASPQKPLDLKQLKQRAAAIPPIVSPGPTSRAPGLLPSQAAAPEPLRPPLPVGGTVDLAGQAGRRHLQPGSARVSCSLGKAPWRQAGCPPWPLSPPPPAEGSPGPPRPRTKLPPTRCHSSSERRVAPHSYREALRWGRRGAGRFFSRPSRRTLRGAPYS